MSKITRPDIIARMVRAANCTINRRKGLIFQAKLPGFSYDDFNRAGYLSLFKIARLLETERAIFFHKTSFNYRDLMVPYEVMMFGSHITVSKTLYEKACLDLPMTLDAKLLHLGETSFDVQKTLVDATTGEDLVSTIRRVVCVDMKAKCAAKIPEAVHINAQKNGMLHGGMKPSFERFNPLTVPVNHFKYSFVVAHDDMDFLFHTNQAAYTRFAENCAAVATQAGFYRNFHKDISFYQVQKASTLHVGESFAGDQLEMLTWQDEDDCNTVYFVTKKDGKDICYSKFIFFPMESS